MEDLIFARMQMGVSLVFHIVFACIGVAMPLLMVIAEWLWLKTGDDVYLDLAKRWAKGTAILFAVGAVSGTVISFELGLLWPKFMEFAGAVIGMPFALEGFAFFTEAIFLGIYLYGWEKVSKVQHLLAGVVVALSGAASATFVVIANAWMNTPAGFRLENGKPVDIDPVAAMFTPAALPQILHMDIAAYAATGFLVAGIHAFMLLKDKTNRFHRAAFAIALSIGVVMGILEPLSGDFLAKTVAHFQPVKLAAFEAHFQTEAGAPLQIGGIPDLEARENKYAISIPYLLSILAFSDPKAVVKGLNDYPRDLWPNIYIIRNAFQIMLGCGMVMMLVSLWAAFIYWRKRVLPDSTTFLKTMVFSAPLGFLAVECGWLVTEVGRQPWVIQSVLKTADVVTPMPGLIVPFAFFSLLYVFLFVIVVWLIRRQVIESSP
ncbi:MAG: cytochrome ubiquinol oxidase subunit I [Candidatus Obscuribacterales bacterium]|nr:cytochrome ubiquinol oxidase subunit I [Candidatus Obscuribacterales bacterium]